MACSQPSSLPDHPARRLRPEECIDEGTPLVPLVGISLYVHRGRQGHAPHRYGYSSKPDPVEFYLSIGEISCD